MAKLGDWDEYVKRNWPSGVPRDCTKLVGERDCLERGVSELKWCASCAEYERLWAMFSLRSSRKRMAVVSSRELRRLVEWCADAIDFKDESDVRAAKALRAIVREADLHFHHGLLGNL